MIYDPQAVVGERETILNPWMFGLEVVQQGWQAQSALAFRLMLSFAEGVADQIPSRIRALTPFPTMSERRKRPQLPLCERRPPQSSRGKRPRPQLPMCEVAKPRRLCGPSKRHLALRPEMHQNGRPQLATIPREKRYVDLDVNRDRFKCLMLRSFAGPKLRSAAGLPPPL